MENEKLHMYLQHQYQPRHKPMPKPKQLGKKTAARDSVLHNHKTTKTPTLALPLLFCSFAFPRPNHFISTVLSSPSRKGRCTIFCTTGFLFTYLFMLSFATSFLGLFPSKSHGKQSPITPLQKYPTFALKLGN